MFKFKEKEEEDPTKKFQEKYDIFSDSAKLISLENEIKASGGDFYTLCEKKGYIRIIPRNNEITADFTVDPDCAKYFADYCAQYKALQKRQDYFRRKQEEADKQRLQFNS